MAAHKKYDHRTVLELRMHSSEAGWAWTVEWECSDVMVSFMNCSRENQDSGVLLVAETGELVWWWRRSG